MAPAKTSSLPIYLLYGPLVLVQLLVFYFWFTTSNLVGKILLGKLRTYNLRFSTIISSAEDKNLILIEKGVFVKITYCLSIIHCLLGVLLCIFPAYQSISEERLA